MGLDNTCTCTDSCKVISYSLQYKEDLFDANEEITAVVENSDCVYTVYLMTAYLCMRKSRTRRHQL